MKYPSVLVPATVGPIAMHLVDWTLGMPRRRAGCLVLGLVVIITGLTAKTAQAEPLEAAAESYRPLMTEEIIPASCRSQMW
jgi:hypothetical protein